VNTDGGDLGDLQRICAGTIVRLSGFELCLKFIVLPEILASKVETMEVCTPYGLASCPAAISQDRRLCCSANEGELVDKRYPCRGLILLKQLADIAGMETSIVNRLWSRDGGVKIPIAY
jgi:hypothetical protein